MDQVQLNAYPPFVFYLAITVGIALAVYNPRWLFFVVLAGLTTMDISAYFFTRLEGSPFFNFFDLHVLFGLLAALLIRRDTTRGLPLLFGLIIADICIGFTLSYSWLGFNYDAIRSVRQALNFPLLWFIAFRCVNTRHDARIFLHIIILGCVIQSLRQCVFVAHSIQIDTRETTWRTIRFLNAGMVLPPLCCLVLPLSKNPLYKFFLYASAGLSTVAVVLTQTRSFWIPQAVVLVIGGFILARRKMLAIVMYCIPGIVLCALTLNIFAPEVDLQRLFLTGHATDFSSGSGRENVLSVEFFEWLKGNVILGRGLGFFYSRELIGNYPRADWWGHIGYIAYLSNLGLVGFYLFAIAYPKLALSQARVLWNSADAELRLFGLIAGCLTWTMIVGSFLSGGLMFAQAFTLTIMTVGAACSMAFEAAAWEDEREGIEEGYELPAH
jgi:hypothetical protein